MNLKNQALELYKTVFYEDDEHFAETFTNKYFENSCRFILKDGKMIAMLYLIDCTFKNGNQEYPAKYLYAAGVLPEYRKQGIMSKLLNDALAEENIIITKPANSNLFAFYEKFGFKVCAYKDELTKSFKNPTSTENYINKRKELLKNIPHIVLKDEEFSLKDLTLYADDNFIVAADPDTNEIKEYIQENKDLLNGKTPFAMWKHKNNNLPSRIYFGIAMD